MDVCLEPNHAELFRGPSKPRSDGRKSTPSPLEVTTDVPVEALCDTAEAELYPSFPEVLGNDVPVHEGELLELEQEYMVTGMTTAFLPRRCS